jgi:predicted dehydrogenase
MSKKLKVGVIGIGGIAHTHMPGWAQSELTEVVAAADINPEILESFGGQHEITRLYSDSQEMIASPDIDIIDICTPNMYHEPLTIAALDAGKHVMCEKPLAPTPEAVQRMIAARDRSGKMLMTAQHQRFNANSKALKAEIGTGALGDIYHARSWMLRRAAYPGRASFVQKKHSGGGPCIDIGVHVLDLTLWLMGNPKPVTVSGSAITKLARQPGVFTIWGGNPPPEGWDVEEFATAFVRFENGATLMLEVSWLLHHDTPGEDRQIWLYGTEGGTHLPKCEIYQTNRETKQLYNRTLQLTQDQVEPHALQCIEFAQAIADGGSSPVPAEQSLQVMSILDAVYKSQETGREVVLDH